MEIVLHPMERRHVPGAVALQRACFPAPFPEELLWQPEHLERHLEVFPPGQWVALEGDQVVASASSLIVSEERFTAHANWDTTVGGPFLTAHEDQGSTLYGVDISVHPKYRKAGLGRALYGKRFDLVRRLGLTRYGTACRLPGYASWSVESGASVEQYVEAVAMEHATDRTLSPLLRYGLQVRGVIHGYMDDPESGNAAAVLEWLP